MRGDGPVEIEAWKQRKGYLFTLSHYDYKRDNPRCVVIEWDDGIPEPPDPPSMMEIQWEAVVRMLTGIYNEERIEYVVLLMLDFEVSKRDGVILHQGVIGG